MFFQAEINLIMSTKGRIVFLIVGFLLEVSSAADPNQILNSTIKVTSTELRYDNWIADRVNDGIYRFDANDCGCCTALTRPAWVQLTLDKAYLVEKIVILGRTDYNGQFENITLSLGQDQYVPFTLKNWSVAMTILKPPREVNTVRVSGASIQRPIQYMTICEIMIYRQPDCLPGKYSANCSKECHCLSTPCDSVTGTCMTAVCKDGWRGLACNEPCKTGIFGSNCSYTCRCLNNVTCNHVDGGCQNNQCAAGWTHDNCSVVCNPGMFGLNCVFPCHCPQKKECDHVSGYCTDGICAPGWMHNNCSVECDQGHFGENCSSPCHCLDGVSCDHVSGHCHDDQCASGWTGNNCSIVCDHGMFGNNCSFPCHCLHGERCDRISGHCMNEQCAPGWTLRNCSAECGQGMFGVNCTSACNCLPGVSCSHVSGHCSDDQCAAGWTSYNCSIACTSGFYGQSCSNECHCDTCHHVNGSCVGSQQCHDGFRMDNGLCTRHEQIGDTLNVAGVVCGFIAAVVIILGIIVAFVYYRRRKLHSANGNTKLTTPDKMETCFDNGFDNIDRVNDGNNIFVQDKAEVSSKYVSSLLPGKQNPVTYDDNDYYSFKTLSPGIKIHELWDYIHEKCQSGSTFFAEEFKKFRSGLIHKHDIASSEENKGKTRYKQMYAYDHNRVLLTKEIDGDSEYINASYIHGFEKSRKFIASQGATENNLVDFWRMIWHQRVDKIVMLTNLVEHVTMKCLQYWPEELNGVCKYGRFDVKYVGVEEMFDYNIRTFTIAKEHDTRVVKQFHFKSWPDKDVPDTAWCLVDFWRAVDTQKEHHSPILVHCSAGVGRTGTFIALDNLISQAQIENCVRPFQIVTALREQRVSMVQTEEQYAYLHEALAEALLMGTHHVVTRQFESVYNFMIGKDSISTTIRLEQQFELLMQSVDGREGHLQQVASQEAEYCNIGAQMAETEAYRPHLCKKSEPPDEVNLPTFTAKTGIIVLHKPNKEQLPLFWSRLKQIGCVTVIDLASDDLELKRVLIDRKDEVHATKGLSVIKKSQKNGFVEITYSMKHEASSDKTITHFVTSSWKGADLPTDKKSLLEMIEAVHTWQSEMTDDKPILILDNGGFQKCGVVAVLLNEIYRILEQKGRINIVQSVKTMVHGNRLLIRSKKQYKFCYDVILDYIQQQGVYQNN